MSSSWKYMKLPTYFCSTAVLLLRLALDREQGLTLLLTLEMGIKEGYGLIEAWSWRSLDRNHSLHQRSNGICLDK